MWFEQSGHPPDFEEPEKFQRELIAIGKQFCQEASAPAELAAGAA